MPRRPHPAKPPRPASRGGLPSGAARGFTLVELIVVMLLLAVLATVSAARFADRQPFAAQGLADQIASGLRLAQATAQAQRRSVHVVLAATPVTLSVCFDAGCSTPIAPPGGDAWLADTAALQLAAPASFSFDASGAPSLASALTLTVQASGGGSTMRTVRVEPVSGHVRVQ